MEFKDKYCNEKDKDKPENINKIVLTNESFAVCELLYDIKVQLFRTARK